MSIRQYPIDSSYLASDSESILALPEDEKKQSLFNMVGHTLGNINFKMLILLFLTFLFINSDIFINRILSRINGAVSGKVTTSWGVVIQALIFIFIYALLSILNVSELI